MQKTPVPSPLFCFFFFFFLLSSTSLFVSVQSAVDCTFEDSGGRYFDLSKMENSTNGFSFVQSINTYIFGICRVPAICSLIDPNAASCLVYGTTSVVMGTLPSIKFAELPKTDPDYGNGVLVIYSQGTTCGSVDRNVTIKVRCDVAPGLGVVINVAQTGVCAYAGTINSQFACPTAAPSHFDMGWIFVIIVVVVAVIYFAVGVTYKVFAQKVQFGLEAIPNIDFWKDLPSLVKDGCFFVFYKVFRRGYSQV